MALELSDTLATARRRYQDLLASLRRVEEEATRVLLSEGADDSGVLRLLHGLEQQVGDTLEWTESNVPGQLFTDESRRLFLRCQGDLRGRVHLLIERASAPERPLRKRVNEVVLMVERFRHDLEEIDHRASVMPPPVSSRHPSAPI